MGAKIQMSFEHNSPWSGTEHPLYKDNPSKLRLSEHFKCGSGMKKKFHVKKSLECLTGLKVPISNKCYATHFDPAALFFQ